MSRRDFSFLRLAIEAAQDEKDNGRIFFLGCVAIRADGKLVKGRNQSCPSSPGPVTKYPNRRAHAEYRVAQKLDYNAEVFVARIRADGTWALARPCENCLKILKVRKVKRICYTISDKEYGVLSF